MSADKKALRDYFNSIIPADRETKDKKIFASLVNHPAYQRANNVFVFFSVKNEPSTKEIISRSFEYGKRVFVPVINGGSMMFSEIFPITRFVIRKFGLWEPETTIISDIEPDIVITPMVAYDDTKARLGHGKGYYDKFLAGKNVFKLGISYTDFRAESVFAKAYDIPMDIIITDGGVLK